MQSKIHDTLLNLEKLSYKALEKIGNEHLEYSNYKIFGYWDENDNYYEEITFKLPLTLELSSYSVGKTLRKKLDDYWIKLEFKLKAGLMNEQESKELYHIVGQLSMILDINFQFIDEIWSIDVNSPFIIVNCAEATSAPQSLHSAGPHSI